MKKVYIVNHTHWDREWYKTKEEYLMHLRSGVSYLLKEFSQKRISKFYFDGQTIILEDLKEVLSNEEYDQFLKLIKEQKIEVGPWYVLPDEGLIDEIGLFKNLEIGQKICEQLELPIGKVLYLPDTFGHNSRMPTIAKKFNLEYSVIHRGLNTTQVDCLWVDQENKLKTIVLPTREGYYQTMFHHPNYEQLFIKYIKAYQANNSENDILILNGCDHTFMPKNYTEKLNSLKEQFKDQFIFEEVTLTEFFEKNNYMYQEEIKGEFRKPSKAFLLPGVLSTRYYLKKDNRIVTDLVKYFYEPLINKYELSNQDKNLERIWKRIVQNHPHDSICGCSIDAVHREMEVRTRQIKDNINTAIFEIFNEQYPINIENLNDQVNINYDQIVITNPSKKPRLINFTVELPLKLNLKNKQIGLITKCGQKQYAQIINTQKQEVLFHRYFHEPTYLEVQKVKCQMFLESDKLINNFKLTIENDDDNQSFLENSKFSVDNKGNLIDNSSNNIITNLVDYTWITDRGDSYNFDPVGTYEPFEISSNFKIIYKNSIEYKLDSKAKIRLSLAKDRVNRTGKNEQLKIITSIVICLKTNQIYQKVKINNQHENIKVVKKYANMSKIKTNTALDLITRHEINTEQFFPLSKNEEAYYNQYPTISEIYANDSIQISHLGNQEVELKQNEILHTLYRAIGDLSRRDLKYRQGGAGPSYEAKEANCQRPLEFNFLVEFTDEYLENNHLNLHDVFIYQY